MVEFLRRILPSDGGFFCIVGIKKGIVKPRFVPVLDGVDDLAGKLCGAEYNVYFACATYKDEQAGRKVENIKSLKSFFLDIDCGEKKPYETKEAGLAALSQFVKTHGLPKPWLIDSGGGIHAYWELSEPVEYEPWKETADKLKMLCKEGEFFPDPAVTADGARILRLPNTENLKEPENPRPVKILLEGKAVKFEEFRSKINPMQSWIAPKTGWKELDPVTKAFLGKNFVASFEKILNMSLEGRGCEHIKFLYENQAAIQEPLWRAGLSVAAFCQDNDTAIHTISDKYPGYNKEETIHKASLIKGPYTCEKFSELGSSEFCSRCEYGKGTQEKPKVRSPISIGRIIAEAKDEDRYVTQYDNSINEMVMFEIPDYPQPYFRKEGGGVFKRSWHEEDKDKEVYEHDLYIIKRYKDPDEGDVATLRLHTPKDGVIEFQIPTSELVNLKTVETELSKNGVYCYTAHFKEIQQYLQYSLQELQKTIKADVAQPHMGWVNNHKAFIIGAKEVSAAGVINGPPSKYTKALAKPMHKKGELSEWKKTIQIFNDLPKMETHAFVFLSAFGAPLMEFTDTYGATFIAKSAGSGHGKTAVLFAINSVWGHPKDVMTDRDGTENFKLNRVGMFRNLPVCWDEMTGLTGEELSDFLYSISSGKGKGRMERQANVERVNYSEWRTIVLFSSNQDNAGTLLSIKRSPQAELARFMEFEFHKNPIIEAMEDRLMLFSPLSDNYGIAGEIYAQYLVENVDAVRDAVTQMRRKLVKVVNPKSHMRFWIDAIACNIVGGIIATKLGLIDFDMKRIYNWIVKHIGDIRVELLPDSLDQDPLGDYVRIMYGSYTLVINAGKVENMPEGAIHDPRNSVLVRVEPDTKRMYLAVSEFREYCVKQQIHLDQLLEKWTKAGICLGVKKVKILRGTKLGPAATATTNTCIVIDLSKVSDDSTVDYPWSDVHGKPEEAKSANVSVSTDIRSPTPAEGDSASGENPT